MRTLLAILLSGLLLACGGGGETATGPEEGDDSGGAPAFSAWKQLAAGLVNSCGVDTNGLVYCWGDNAHGQPGFSPPPGTVQTPVRVSETLVLDHVVTGGAHVCGVTPEGAGFCWGANGFGELGNGESDVGENPDPDQVQGVGAPFVQISAGGSHTCGVTTGDAAYCWGNNGSGQLGDGTTTDRTTPAAVEGDLGIVQVSAGVNPGGNHTCGVTAGGAAYCWGVNANGQVGDGTTTERHSPVQVKGGLSFEQVTASGAHSCGVAADGTAYCWGANGSGQLGDGTKTDRHEPVQVAGAPAFASIVAGAGHTCALTDGGTAYCWGANGSGQLGDGTNTGSTEPVEVAGGHTFVQIDTRFTHVCGVTDDGRGFCWGENSQGKIGDGTETDRNVPTEVTDP